MSAEPPAEIVRCRMIYQGRVQGVGFRHTAANLARHFVVAGFVRNLPDRAVELEAQGAPGEVDKFLAAIKQHFLPNIANETRSDLPPRGDETTFEIRY